MSDTSAIEPTTPAGDGAQPGETKPVGADAEATSTAAPAKPPQRPVAEIRADIEKERGELSGSFAQLRGELDEAVDEGRRRASAAGKKAKKVAPIVAGAAVALVVAGSLLRRRSRR